MTLQIVNEHPVQAYIDEKQRIYQHIQNSISNVMTCLIEDLVPLFSAEGQSNLQRCVVLSNAMEIAIGNNNTDLPSHCENKVRSKVWEYLGYIDVKELAVEGHYSENGAVAYHSCHISFRQPSLFQKLETSFDLKIDDEIHITMQSIAAMGTPALQSISETARVTLPLIEWLDLHDMREYQALFDEEWKELKMLAALKQS